MRPDASKATDLTSYAQQAPPRGFSPLNNVPYPGTMPESAALGGKAANKRSSMSAQSVFTGAGKSFLSLGRRTSPRASSPNMAALQSPSPLSRPSLHINGPRSSMSAEPMSSTASGSSSSGHAVRPVTNDEIEKLQDVLPQASRNQLTAYIRKTNGDSTLALQCFLEDERRGQLIC